MNSTAGIFTASSERDSVGTLCRLCMKINDYYYNVFTSNVACRLTAKDAINGLLGIEVAVGDGLPTALCPLCLKKLTELSVFKMTCLESDAKLRNVSGINCFRSIQGDEAADDEQVSSADTKDFIQDEIQGTSHLTHSVHRTEIYIPVSDSRQFGDNMLETVKEENEDPLSEGKYPVMNTLDPAVMSSNALDPLATDDLPITLTASQSEKVEAQSTGATMADLEWTLMRAKKEPSPEEDARPTSGEDWDPNDRSTTADESTTGAFGVQTVECMAIQTTSTSYLPAEGSVRNRSIDECIGPASLVTEIDSRTPASHAGIGRNLMDKVLEKCDALYTEKITCGSISDDRQCNTKYKESFKGSAGGAAMTVDREKCCDEPNTTDYLKLIRISGSYRSGYETVVRDNVEIHNCLIKNPGNSYRSKEDSCHCFNCRDRFNNKNELVQHMKIHFVTRNFDALAESSIGDVSLKTLPPCRNSSSFEPTTSKALSVLRRKRLERGQKRNGILKKTSGGKGDEKNIGRVLRSYTLDEKSTSQSLSCKSSCVRNLRNHVAVREKGRAYSCSVCAKCFTQNGDLMRHTRIHTGERPYSCDVCEKSFAQSGNLDSHMRTHTGEKPFSCRTCNKYFTRKSSLNLHVRAHTGDKPHICKVCGKSFTRRTSLVSHTRTHAHR